MLKSNQIKYEEVERERNSLAIQKLRLLRFVSEFKSNNSMFMRIQRFIHEKVNVLLRNNMKLLELSLMSALKAFKDDPNVYRYLFHKSSVMTTEELISCIPDTTSSSQFHKSKTSLASAKQDLVAYSCRNDNLRYHVVKRKSGEYCYACYSSDTEQLSRKYYDNLGKEMVSGIGLDSFEGMYMLPHIIYSRTTVRGSLLLRHILPLVSLVYGKIRLKLTPLENHWWNVTLYITPRGLTTSTMSHESQHFQIDFDFIAHLLRIETTVGSHKTIGLRSQPVAEFYQETMAALKSLRLSVNIWTTPSEVPDPIPFERDRKHATYDPEYANRLWRILVEASRVFKDFRSRFIGKVSPVHFFWGGFDLAVTRFSGRPAPAHPGTPYGAHFVDVEAYSQEVSSCGFWPGGGPVDKPVFYAYPIQNLRASRTIRSSQQKRITMPVWVSSFCHTMKSVHQNHLTIPCYHFYKALMR